MSKLISRAPFALLFLCVSVQAQPYFDAPWQAYSTGTFEDGRFPVTFALADFDGDGHVDAVVGHNVEEASLRLLFNDGTGVYVTGPTLPLERGTWHVVAADVNGDGHADIVASDTDLNYVGSTVAVFLNNGNGTFAPRQNYQVGNGPAGIVAADVNGDGHLDLAVTNYGFIGQGTSVWVLLNNGDGTFGAAISHTVPAAPWRIAAGDLDGDGLIDLVIGHDFNRISVLRNLGSGGFAPAQQHIVSVVAPSGNNFYPAVALADVDGDGDLDVLFVNTNLFADDHSTAVLFRNDGTGAFTQQGIPLRYYGPSPVDIATPDLNGDGAPDLLVAGYLGNTDGIMIALNNGAGQFGPAELYAAGEETIAVASADVDGDGILDVLTLDRNGRLLTVHRGLGNGTLPERPIYGDMFVHQSLHLGDMDNDGHLDAVTSHHGASGSSITVLRGDGFGGFAPHFNVPSSLYAYASFADMNGDGALDLLFMSARGFPPYDVFISFGDGTGAFGPVQLIEMNSCGWGTVEAFDLNGNGHLDIVASEQLGCIGEPASAKRLFIRLNNGDGTFGPLDIIQTTPAPRPMAAGDFNGDGHLDLAVAGAAVAIHFGNGDGTFQPFVASGSLLGPQRLLAADFDGDGSIDVAVGDLGGGDYDAGLLVLMRGLGDGSFDPAVVHTISGRPSGLAMGDVNRDGHPDLIMSSSTRDASIFLNDGAGQFALGDRPGVARSSWSVQFADINDDGLGDLVALAQQEVPAGGFHLGVVIVPGAERMPVSGEPSAPRQGVVASSVAYPNPFSRATEFVISADRSQEVGVEVFDSLGRRVALLYRGTIDADVEHRFTFEAGVLPSGLYVIRATGETFTTSKKVTLLR